jgi:hypothetical protein
VEYDFQFEYVRESQESWARGAHSLARRVQIFATQQVTRYVEKRSIDSAEVNWIHDMESPGVIAGERSSELGLDER